MQNPLAVVTTFPPTVISQIAIISNQRRRCPSILLDIRPRLPSKLLDPVDHSIHSRQFLQRHEISSQTGDMRTSHARSAQSSRGGITLDADALDANTWCEDIHAAAEVAEGCPLVGALVDGADGYGCRCGTGRGVGCVLVFVAGCYDGDDTCSCDGVYGVVHGAGEAAAQGHVHDGFARELGGCGVFDDCGMLESMFMWLWRVMDVGVGSFTKIHTGQDAGGGAASVGIEDLDGHELDVLGHTKGLATNGASNVATVSVFVGVLDSESVECVSLIRESTGM